MILHRLSASKINRRANKQQPARRYIDDDVTVISIKHTASM